MTTDAKRFLLKLAVIALIGWMGANWLLGGPGLSRDYLASHAVDHEHYIEAIKSDEYKHYRERPALFNLDENTELKRMVDFVDTYTANEAFAAEQHRVELRSIFFDFFNATLVVILALKFGRPPLLRLLDNQAEALREKLNQAARARSAANARLSTAQEKSVRLHEVELRVNAETESRLEREMSELAAANHYSFSLHERDLAERRVAAELAAEHAVRRALVDEAMKDLHARIETNNSPEFQDRSIAQFVRELEAKP